MKPTQIQSLLLGMLFVSSSVYAQNNCNSAISLDPVPSDALCGPVQQGGNGGVGSFTTPILSSAPGSVSNPYIYVPGCNGGIGPDMEIFGYDTWYSFTATANILNVDLSGISNMDEANVGFYSGTCATLVGLGCSVGTPSGGSYSALLEPLTPGETYYIQVSGDNDDDNYAYNITISNDFDCSDCMTGSSLTVTPPPLAGTYQPGDVVSFCYTITDYEQVSSNWLHGVQLDFGAGWDLTTLTTTSPGSCDGSGFWDYYPGGATSSATGIAFGSGFYFDYNTASGDPGNNYGDYNAENCDLEFCWTITVNNPSCDPLNPPSLAIIIGTTADGESGSWTSIACQDDPDYVFNAIISCCIPPALVPTPVSCSGGDGTITATIDGATAGTSDGDVYQFTYYDADGNFIATLSATVTGAAGDAVTSLTGLATGDYTVVVSDPVGCASSEVVTIDAPPGTPTVTVPADMVICSGDVVPNTNFVTNPAQSPEWDFNWTSSTDIGNGTSGVGDFTFTSSNPGSTVLIATIEVTPDDGTCLGIPNSFTITVNPSPIVTISAAPDTLICSGETVDLTGTYIPQPSGIPTSFENLTNVSIPGNGNNPGSSSVTSSGISPDPIQTGQLTSICFTLELEDPGDYDPLVIIVDGVTYSSATNTDLSALLATINAIPPNAGNGNPPPITQNFCIPQAFLDMIEASGVSSNVTWTIELTDAQSGGDIGTILDFEVVIEDAVSYTYAWTPTGTLAGSTSGSTSGGSLIVTASPTADELYTLTVIDDAGCTGTETIDIIVTTPPTATIITSSAVYCQGTTPSGVNIDVILTGTPDWTLEYAIDGVTQVAVSGIAASPYTISNASGTAAGAVYTIVSIADQGCPGGSFLGSFTVTENPEPTITGNSTICAGGLSNSTVNLTGSGTPASSPAWVITGGTGAATLSNVGSNVGTVTGTAAGTVDIQYSDDNGCVATTTLTINAPPVPVASNTGPFCVGDDIALNLDITGLTTNWAGPNSFVSSLEDPIISNGQLTEAGTYTVTVVDANGCSAAATTTVVIEPLPTAFITGTTTMCAGQPTDLTFTLTGTGTFDVVYSDGTSNFNLNGISDGATVSVSPSTTTTYTLVSVLDNGTICFGTVSGSAMITITPLPTAAITASPGPICAGEDAVFTINGTPGATLTYSADGGTTNLTVVLDGGGAATITVPTSSPSSANITLDLSLVQLSACSDVLTETSTIVVNNLPTYTIVSSLDPIACGGTNGEITIGGLSPNTTYDLTYDGPSGTVGPVSITTDGSGEWDITSLVAGGYDNFIINDGTCENTLSNPVSLVSPGAPVFTISLSQSPSTCIPGNEGAILITGLIASTNYNLTYISPAGVVGPLVIGTDPSGDYILTGLTAGSYTSFSVELGGCTGTQPGPINLVSPATPVVNAVAVPTSICSDANAFMLQENGGATTISWLWSSNGSATITTNTDQNPAVTNAANGEIFTVVVTNTTTFCADSVTTSISLVQAANAGIDSTVVLCNSSGSTIDLNSLLSSGVSGGTWAEITSSGQFNASIGLLDAGGLSPVTYTFEYTITGVSPCLDDLASFDVVVTALPNAGANNAVILCNSGAAVDLNTLLDVGVSGGTWSETTSPNPSSGSSFDPVTGLLDGAGLAAGNYTFIYDIPATSSCLGDQATMTVSIAFQETAGLDDLTTSLCNSSGTTIDLNTLLNGNSTGGTWGETTSSGQFTAGTGVFDASLLSGGQYNFSYMVNSSSSCIADTANFTITVNEDPVVNPGPVPAEVCEGLILALSGGPTGGSTPYVSNVWTGAGVAFLTDPTLEDPVFNSSMSGGGSFSLTYTVTDLNSCSASGNVSIIVYPMLNIAAVNNGPYCEGEVVSVYETGGAAIVWSWSSSGTAVFSGSTSQVPTVTGVMDGEVFTVIATDANLCQDTAQTTVVINSLPIYMLTPTDPMACNVSDGSILIDGLVASTDYEVTYFDGTNTVGPSTMTSTGTGQITIATLGSGTYDVSLSVTLTGCTGVTVTTTLVDPGAPVLILNNPPSVCSPTTIDLTDTLLSSTDIGTIAYYNDPGLTTLVTDPTQVGDGTYYVEATNATCSVNDSIVVVVNTSPTLTLNDPAVICDPATADLTDPLVSNTDVGTMAYYIDAGLTTLVSDANSVGAGTYYVEATNAACTDTGSVVVTVNQLPTATSVGNGPICAGSDAIFTITGTVDAIVTYSINGGPSITDTLTGGLVDVTVVGAALDQTLVLELVDDGACSDLLTETLTITVLPPLSIVPQDDVICAGETASVGVSVTGGTGGPYTVVWDNGLNGTSQPITGLVNDTSYVVDVSDGCSTPTSTVVAITVNPVPDADFFVSGGSCAPATVKVNATTGVVPVVNWYWNFGDGTSSSDPDSSTHVYVAAGIYDITLIVTSGLGCSDTVLKPGAVNVSALPSADFEMMQNGTFLNSNVATILSPSINFVNTSSANVDNVVWDFGDLQAGSGNTSTDLNPVHVFSDTGTYVITLTVYTSDGCPDVITQELVIEGEYILFAPNSFTPNNDGFNDFFLPKGVGLVGEKFNLIIYNRWGDLIREVSGVFSDDVTTGWDGRANGGTEIVQLDVYVWVIQTSEAKGGGHKYVGHVTLFR